MLQTLLLAAAALAVPPAGTAAAGAAAAPNVLLVTIDTLRADHVGAYGYAGAQTRTIDRLAREGVRLADAVVQVPQTRPSHACIMTGRLPYEHGIRDNYSPPLPPTLPTLASVLAGRGWDTAGFVGAYPVSRPSGLDRGFALYDDPFAAGDSTTREARTERRAKEVVDHALAWLAKPRSEAVLRLGPPVRPARPVRGAGAVRHALREAAVRRRGGLCRRAARPARRVARRAGPARAHARGRDVGPRRGPRRPRRGRAHVLRLRLDAEGPARDVVAGPAPGGRRGRTGSSAAST